MSISSASSQRVKLRKAALKAELALLNNAIEAGVDTSDTWDGRTPFWILGTRAMGWRETFDCILAACQQARSARNEDLIQDIRRHIDAIASTIITVSAYASKETEPSLSSHQAKRLLKRLGNIKNCIVRVAETLCHALHEAQQEIQATAFHINHPVFLAHVYNHCFLNTHTHNLLLDVNVVAYTYMMNYSTWRAHLET